MNIDGAAIISYTNTSNVKRQAILELDGEDVVGNCSDAIQGKDNFAEVVITRQSMLTLALKLLNKDGTVYLDSMSYTYDMSNKKFINPKQTGTFTDALVINQRLSNDNKSSICQTEQIFQLNGNATIDVTNFKLQAFNVKNDQFSEADEESCYGSSSTAAPSTKSQPTDEPTSAGPTTNTPPTTKPTEEPVTTKRPSTSNPTEEPVTTKGPTTANPTEGPTTASPTEGPTTASPTEGPTTASPTEEPTTTTPKPEPTTAGPTQEPTSKAPITTVKPTVVPGPPKYDVRDDATGNICLIVQTYLHLDIKYQGKGNKTLSKSLTLDKAIKTSGRCEKNVNSITLYYSPASTVSTRNAKENLWQVEMEFKNDNISFTMSSFQLEYYLDPVIFTNATNPGEKRNVSNEKMTSYNSALGSFYSCKANDSIDLGSDVKVTTSELEIEAFNHDKKDNFDKQGTQCSLDDETNNVIPIVVGVVLCLLVVIVLVAYFIGRRRRSTQGYEQI